MIKQCESEPYHQYQNKTEQCYGVVKRYINTLMNLRATPAHCYLLCLVYVCALLNVTASPNLNGITPIQALTRQVPDISFLHNSMRNEDIWVGFANKKGDQLNWKILTDETQQIIA